MASGGGGRPSVPALGLLNKRVAAALAGTELLESLDTRKPLVVAFVDAVLSTPDLADDIVANALREAGAVADALADACLANPREFWKVVSVYQPLIAKVPVEAPAFRLAAENFSSLGDVMVTKVCHIKRA